MHQFSWQYLYDDYQESSEEETCLSDSDNFCQSSTKSEGIFCNKCKDFFHWAEANQPDGKTFICRDCKLNPWRSSPIYPDD